MKLAKILDLSHIQNKRFIIIGDIHGSFNPFIDLLDNCNYNKDNDIIISVGDLADRGPDSHKVLAWFMQNKNIYCAQGNHDNKLMRYLGENKVSITHGLEKTLRQISNWSELDKSRLYEYLNNLPHIIKLPNVNQKETYVVHAGFMPGIPIEKQSLEYCLYIRGVNPKDFFDESKGIWYDHMDNNYNIFCGHIVHQDYGPYNGVWCLDGGACHGAVLRAAVIENDKIEIIEVPGLKKELNMNDPIESRDDLVAQGYLRCDKLDNFKIYTYTPKTVFENYWNEITLNSRGHIFDIQTGECIARPFPKFFNLNEKPETQENILPWGDGYEIFVKEDGWLGTLYRHNNQYKIATRGSFRSEGAIWATEFLNKNHNLDGLPDEVTLVFEIISSITKIVVDYKNEYLCLTAAFNRHTGEEYSRKQVEEWGKKFNFILCPVVRIKNNSLEDIKQECKTLQGDIIEGFVIRFNNGLRVKIKGEDYLKRHKLISNITPLNVWRILSEGKSLKDYISNLPKEYEKIVLGIVKQLNLSFDLIHADIYCEYNDIMAYSPKDIKEFAMLVQKSKSVHSPALFSLYKNDHKITNYIYQKIRPKNNILQED